MRKTRCDYARNWLRSIPFWATLLAITLLMVPVVSAANIEVFSQNYPALGSIPSNVVNTNYQSPYISNISMWYSGGRVNGEWNATNKDGYIFIGGLTPAVNTTYNLVLDFDKTVHNTNFNIKSGYMWLVLYKDENGDLRVYQHFDEDANPAVSFTVPAASIAYPFNLTITFDGANHIYSSTLGAYTQTTPFIGGNDPLAYPVVQGNDMQFSAFAPAGESNATISIYSLNQTIPATGSVTAIGDKNLVSFGFDGPQKDGSWENGAAYIDSTGGKGTIWADPRWSYTNAVNQETIKDFLDEGWELGIRFPESLTSFSDPYAMIDDNTTEITEMFGQSPTSWCSMQNTENATLANYSYNNHGMIWRNGLMGQAELSNIGMLHNGTWPFWANVSKGGITFRSFVYKTDIDPAETWSIDTSKFNAWVDNYGNKGMKISPYINWYKTGANTYNAVFTENTDTPAVLNFTADTNGYPAYVYVDLPFASGYDLYNITSGKTEVSYTAALDGNIQFYVDDGSTYYIPAPAPTVSAITPATGENTGSVSITDLAGTGFFDGAKVNLTKTGESNITLTSVVINPIKITGDFDLTGTTAGKWNVVVTNSDGQEAMLADGFEITTPAVIPAPTVSTITPATGQNTTTIDITNLAGTGFSGIPAVNLTKAGELNITATGVTVVDPTKVTCSFDLNGQPVGFWDVVVTNPDGQEGSLMGGFEITNTTTPLLTTGIGVFRTGQWILDYGIDGTVNSRFFYGLPTDTPLVGDFNNDGIMDTGVFRSGQWILDYGRDGTVDRRFFYGLPTDTPLVGDFNNDGIMDTGVFRSGQWILDYGMDGTVNSRFFYGLPTDTPLVGNFNNDGTMDIGVFRSGQWILDYGMDGTVNSRFFYGLPTDKPLVGDFNNDGTMDIGVFRSGQWILDYGINGIVDRRVYYGLPTDIPIVGKWA
jgi:hypothetical protein